MVQKIAAFDIGDLLYFGVLIVGALYSWIKKTKEVKNQPQKNVVDTKTSTDQKKSQTKNPIDDFLKEILDQPIIREFSEKQKPKQRVQKEYSFKEDYFEPIEAKKEHKSAFPSFQKTTKKTQPVEYYNGFEKKELNFRDMIILDAIMNRPYK